VNVTTIDELTLPTNTFR